LKGLILILIVLKTAFVFGQVAVFSAKYKTIKFPKTPEGELLSFSYEIKNKGKAPLELYSWEAECTCTDVMLPTEPILPGQFATIDVIFDTNGKYFFQNRIIYIKSNSRKKRELLRFKVFVEPKPMEQEPAP